MVNDEVRPFQTEQIRSELEALSTDITLTKKRLLAHSQNAVQLSPDKPSFRFSTFAAPFRLVRFASGNKKDDKIEGKALLAARRGSPDSDRTLLDQSDDSDPTSELLAVLAPLISTVQKIAPQVRSLDFEVRSHFERVCDQLIDLLDDLQSEESGEGDDHDLEMRSLMLAALTKKVRAERRPNPPNSSPLAPKSLNPFVVHATSLGIVPTRRGSTPKSIPSFTAPPAYSSFVGTAQSSTWAMNVIRLGSFQNSALFSPSPVAVTRLIGSKTKAS